MRILLWSVKLFVSATFAAVSYTSTFAADAFPVKPVRLITAVSAGSTGDVLARLLANELSTTWGQRVIVENRPGSGGIVAAQAMLNSPADGYAIFLGSGNSLTIAQSMYSKLPYNVEKDFSPVALVAEIPLIMAIGPGLPVRNLKELIDYARKNPGKMNYGATGVGSVLHLSGALLMSQTGLDMTYVPYPGIAQALPDVASGRVDVLIEAGPGLSGPVKSGQLRPIAVTSNKRMSIYPDVAAISEVIPGYSSTGFYMLVANKLAPESISRQIHAAVVQVLSKPEMAARLNELGNEIRPVPFDELPGYLRRDRDLWAPVVKRLGIAEK